MIDERLSMVLALLLSALPGCGRRSDGHQAPDSVASSAASPVPSMASAAWSAPEDAGSVGHVYPQARWRMATFDELDRATLWVGHIVIRHKHSNPEGFRMMDWRPDSPNPDRNVARALTLAEKVASLAAESPDTFEELARKYSEDVVTKDDGGALGGVRVSQLRNLDFLDALATLKPGEVSKAFRTPYGFHILKRYAPPREEQVAGQRIVIGYRGVFDRPGESRRSRAEAETLARDVATQAKKDPASFGTLAERYSESAERLQQGDIGVFSTRDPGYLPLEVHRLARLEVGEVTGPHDSCYGYEILKRSAVSPRQAYAATMIEIPFDSTPTQRATSQAQALSKAREMLRTLEAAPHRFDEFQSGYHQNRVERWTRGRGDPELTRALDPVPFGRLAPEPILYSSSYFLAKRLDPSALPPEQPRLTEIPSPREPNYYELLKYNDGAQIADAARSLGQALQTNAGLAAGSTRSIAATLGQLASTLERQPADHVAARAAIDSTLAVLEQRLSADQFALFKQFSRRWAVSQFMPPGSEEVDAIRE
jgi:hypothetical protein